MSVVPGPSSVVRHGALGMEHRAYRREKRERREKKKQSYDFNNFNDLNDLKGLNDTLKDIRLTPSNGQFVKKSACVSLPIC